MSPQMIKENKALQNLADRSSFIGDRTAKVMGAYKSALSSKERSAVDRIVSVLKGKNQASMLNSILRNLEKGTAKPPEQQKPESDIVSKEEATAAVQQVKKQSPELNDAEIIQKATDDLVKNKAEEIDTPEEKQEVEDVVKDAVSPEPSKEEPKGIEAKVEKFLSQNRKFYDGLNNILSSLKAQGDPPEKLELLEAMSPERKLEQLIDRKQRINRYIKTYNKTTDPKAKRTQRGDLRSSIELYISQYNDLMSFMKSSGREVPEASPDGQLSIDQTKKLRPDELPPRQQKKVKNLVLKSVAKAKEVC